MSRALYPGASPLRPVGPTPRALSRFDFVGCADEIMAGWASPIVSGHHRSAPGLKTALARVSRGQAARSLPEGERSAVLGGRAPRESDALWGIRCPRAK